MSKSGVERYSCHCMYWRCHGDSSSNNGVFVTVDKLFIVATYINTTSHDGKECRIIGLLRRRHFGGLRWHHWIRNSSNFTGQFDVCLTHCDPVTPHGDTDLAQRQSMYWLVAWRHQTITWTNVDLSSKGILWHSPGIDSTGIVHYINLKGWVWKLHFWYCFHVSLDNGLTACWGGWRRKVR